MQYIGARYIPLYDSNTWNINKTYEALTVVMAGNNSYISKKYVPAGIQITNTEYWFPNGNVPGIINDMQSQLNEISEKIPYFNTINGISNLNCVIIGDSVGDQIAFPELNVYSTLLKQKIENNGGTCQVFCQSGSGIVGNVNSNNFEQLYNLAQNKEKINRVLIVGFANDISKDVGNNLTSLFNTIKANSPMAIITGIPATRNHQTLYNNLISDISNMWIKNGGEWWPEAVWYTPLRSQLLPNDWTHPNQEGQNTLFNNILNKLMGGSLPDLIAVETTSDGVIWYLNKDNISAIISGNTYVSLLSTLATSGTKTLVSPSFLRTPTIFSYYIPASRTADKVEGSFYIRLSQDNIQAFYKGEGVGNTVIVNGFINMVIPSYLCY